MRIYKMTATFGKLEHQTLELQPGLNIIEAPNEWGKSTWCAFLVNMLYGLDTRARSTGTTLADKERYAPWSGAPMSGRIDLNWNGRRITIERATKGRLIFADFKAYETETGIEIPELNGTNCGQMLLGVERSVFTRAGFLKLADLPVTQDDALRRRLNSLVTTGDESGAGDKLQKTLKDLKNKCRFNRSGLLPQAETQREVLTAQISELNALNAQAQNLRQRQQELENRIAQLKNHADALQYAESRENAQKVITAQQAAADARSVYENLRQNCEGLPTAQEAQTACQVLQALQRQQMDLQTESTTVPSLPEAPAAPAHYKDLTGTAAVDRAKADYDTNAALETGRKKWNRRVWICLILAFIAAAGLAVAGILLTMPVLYIAAGGILLVTCLALMLTGVAKSNRFYAQQGKLFDRYPGLRPDRWVADAQEYADRQDAYEKKLAEITALRGDLDLRQAELQAKITAVTGGEPISQALDRWNQIQAAWDALLGAQQQMTQAESHAKTLASMAKIVEPPKFPDALTYSMDETDTLLQSAAFEQKQTQLKLGQFEGRAEALGQESTLKTQLKAVNRRIQRLEDTYAALELAQTALSAATTQLQRRFAPRISKRAQELFQKLTGGRYDRLTLSSDLGVNACTDEESSLRPALWRSDGTVDQLYLALRLAVAEELTPEAPLVLDDALVRFDGTRLALAMDILKESAENKQVILFTCQGREKALL